MASRNIACLLSLKIKKRNFFQGEVSQKVRHFFFHSLLKVFIFPSVFMYKFAPEEMKQIIKTQTTNCLVTLFTGTAGNYKG